MFIPYRKLDSEVAKKSVSARPGPILDGTLGTRMGPGRAGMAPTSGPGCCKTKHMANLDGTTSDPGWDLEGPRIGPRRGSGWHPPETVTDF